MFMKSPFELPKGYQIIWSTITCYAHYGRFNKTCKLIKFRQELEKGFL